jgi:hypothetical protein
MIIVSVLILMSQNFFKFNKNDNDNSKYCINQIYSKVNDFLNLALNNNPINSWWTSIIPTSYYINFSLTGNNVLLGYKINQTWYVYQNFDLTWNAWIEYNCKQKTYNVILTWETWLQILINQNFIIYSNISKITWEIIFQQCDLSSLNNCKDIWKYEIDKRIPNIQKKLCLYNSWNDCNQWDK